MSEKLRPEQRKLWRRINLTSFDTGSTVEESVANADNMVAQWEERGAFEVETPLQNSLAWNIVAETLHANFPDAFKVINDALTSKEAKLRALVADPPS